MEANKGSDSTGNCRKSDERDRRQLVLVQNGRSHNRTTRRHNRTIMSTATSSTSAPTRVVSLLGAATETIYRLGCSDRLVGRSHECDWPPAVLALPQVSSPRINVAGSSASIDAEVREHAKAGEPVYALDEAELSKLNAGESSGSIGRGRGRGRGGGRGSGEGALPSLHCRIDRDREREREREW